MSRVPMGVARDLRRFLVTAVSISLVAGPAAVLWVAVVPHAGYVDYRGSVLMLTGQEGEFIRGDGWFLVMTLILGAMTGLIAWMLSSDTNTATLLGLLGGGLFGSFAVARIGEQRTDARLHLIDKARELGAPNPLHGHYPPLTHGVLLGWAFAAVVVYAALSAFVRRGPATASVG